MLGTAGPACVWAVPDAPSGLEATPGNTTVTLTWNLPAGNPTSIRIYRNGEQTSELNGSPPPSAYLAGALINGTTYTFQVSAVDATGEGARSDPVVAVPAVLPGAPQNVSAAAEHAPAWGVRLDWGAVAPQTAAVTGYALMRGTTPTALATVIGPAPAGEAPTYLDASASSTSAVGAYYYAVHALDVLGNSGPASAVVEAVVASPTVSAPEDFAVDVQDGYVALSWAPAGGVHGYVRYHTTTPGGGDNATELSGGTTTSQINIGNDGLAYAFAVAGQVGEALGMRASTRSRTLPPDIDMLNTFAGNGYARLSWTPLAASTSPTAYRIYADTGNPPTTQVGEVSNTITAFTYPASQVLNYQVRAVNPAAEGNGGAIESVEPTGN